MQTLKVYQSLWAMERRAPDGKECSDEENFAMIADAGFAGICLDITAEEIEGARVRKPLFEKYGLDVMINAFPKSDEDMKTLLAFAKEMNATTFSIIGSIYPLTAEKAVPIVRKWLELAEDAGVPVMFETHRDCITNDMFLTLQLIEAIPDMCLCADLSHYVLNRELALPLTEQSSAWFDHLIHRADSFQGRISNNEQIQIPIGFERHAPWVELFKTWWEAGFRSWRARNADEATMVFLCELGPPPYAITDAQGYEMSDRWQEALTIKGWVETLWQQTSWVLSD